MAVMLGVAGLRARVIESWASPSAAAELRALNEAGAAAASLAAPETLRNAEEAAEAVAELKVQVALEGAAVPVAEHEAPRDAGVVAEAVAALDAQVASLQGPLGVLAPLPEPEVGEDALLPEPDA
eukprot:7251938-Pyramimonas_sp.AAC.1